jgi:hypothetical protein
MITKHLQRIRCFIYAEGEVFVIIAACPAWRTRRGGPDGGASATGGAAGRRPVAAPCRLSRSRLSRAAIPDELINIK